MKIFTEKIALNTKKGSIYDITEKIEFLLGKSGLTDGTLNIFAIGSTCAITSIEYENGLLKDFKRALESIAPKDIEYEHHKKWKDDNGSSHIKASFLKQFITLGFKEKKLFLGTWQQIVFLELDTQDRQREIVFQFIGV